MADDDDHDEKKDKEKEGDQGKSGDVKRNLSGSKQVKKGSKAGVPSRISLKKKTESTMSGLSGSSSGSLGMKRPSSLEKMAKAPRYQNTYRLDSKRPFKAHEVYEILESIVMREVEDYPNYDSVVAPKIVQAIAADVRASVRLLSYDRYKICVLVYLGEKKFQGFQAAFRALWDQERDGWSTFFYQCRTYFISCTCYGLYHD